MIRRFYGLLASVCLILVTMPAVRAAVIDYDATITGGKIQFDTETGTVTGCDASVTKADIPDEIDGVSVTSIGDRAFATCRSLTSLSIPDSVTSIGTNAFMDCEKLTSISIPDSMTSFGQYAFSGCRSLTSVNIPNGVVSLASQSFYQCTSLTSVSIPNSVTSFDAAVFLGCTSLTDVYYGGTRAEYETKLHPKVWPYHNDEFRNATLHCTDDPAPDPTPTPNPTLPNTAASDNTALHGTAFLILASLTLTVWALGRRKKDRKSAE